MGSIMQVIDREGNLFLEPIVTTGDRTPAGLISAFAGITPPSGWLLCDGAEKLIADYPDLYACIGNIYGTATDADHFVLPDLRESVPKGIGLTGNSSYHISDNGLALGDFIDDRVQEHTHSQTNVSIGSPNSFNSGTGPSMLINSNQTGSNSGRKGPTTEVKAVGMNYIIKY